MSQCTAVTSNGYRCINKAQDCREVCAAHDYRRQCGASTTSGGTCKRMRVQGKAACSYHTRPSAAPVASPSCDACGQGAGTACRVCRSPYCRPCLTDHHHEGYGTPAADTR